MTPEQALQALSVHLSAEEAGQSSHWKLMMESASWRAGAPGARHGLGAFIPRTWRRTLLHEAMQTPFRRLGRKLQAFEVTLAAARRAAAAHERVLDLDDLRQTLTLACVREHVDLSRDCTLAVIGDGYARLASLILQTLPRCRVVLVNLSRALSVDLMSLQRLWPDLEVALIEDGADPAGVMARGHARVLAIRAANNSALRSIRLDGAFNTSSMQEMNPATVADYFGLLRQSPSPSTWFYCANATAKELPDGTVSRFADYPWDSRDEILLDELCPWAQTNYQIWPPRYFPRLYQIRHRLARLSKAA